MKALSIKQPFAFLICAGYKDAENRNWPTKFRGRIYVHASKTFDYDGFNAVCAWIGKGRVPPVDPEEWANQAVNQVLGAIIGEVDIVDCKYRFGEENDNLYSKWHIPGSYGFILANPVLYDKPIPMKGSLGLFDVTLTNNPTGQ